MSDYEYWDINTDEPLTDTELHERYDNMLDDYYNDFMGSYPASRVLKSVDPIAYNCGFNDWLSGELGETITDEEPEDDDDDWDEDEPDDDEGEGE